MNSLQEALYLQMMNYKLKMCKRFARGLSAGAYLSPHLSSGLADLEPSAPSIAACPHSLLFLRTGGAIQGRRQGPETRPRSPALMLETE